MPDANPFMTVRQLAAGYIMPRCLHVIANLGVADALDDSPQSAVELAEAVGTHPEALGRLLRVLSTYGVFAVDGDKFAHTPASRLLRGDHPQSMRSFVRMFGSPLFWNAYGEMEYAARTARPASEKSTSNGFWDYLEAHPDENVSFDEAMVAKSRGAAAAVVGVYDFASFGIIGDIGGGLGTLLRTVLKATPNANGILFDLPHVLAKAKQISSERITFQGGDFFKDQLPPCDAYLLMDVLHDWDDEHSIAILKSIRQSALNNAKVLIIESVVPNE